MGHSTVSSRAASRSGFLVAARRSAGLITSGGPVPETPWKPRPAPRTGRTQRKTFAQTTSLATSCMWKCAQPQLARGEKRKRGTTSVRSGCCSRRPDRARRRALDQAEGTLDRGSVCFVGADCFCCWYKQRVPTTQEPADTHLPQPTPEPVVNHLKFRIAGPESFYTDLFFVIAWLVPAECAHLRPIVSSTRKRSLDEKENGRQN